MNTTINNSNASKKAASIILSYIQGDEETASTYNDAVVSVTPEGTLEFHNRACGINEESTIIIDHFEEDSLGYGWEKSGDAADVMDLLREMLRDLD